MSFDTNSNIVYQENPALAIGAGPIPMDASSISEVSYQFQTNTSAVVNGIGEPQSYNGVETVFDIRIPAQSRVLFDKSYFRFNGFAADMSVSAATPVPEGISIPWNSIAALLETADVQLNQTAQLTEQITQNLGDGSMIKFLTRYSREVLESMDDSLFTPCFEETRDILGTAPPGGSTGLSLISQSRRDTQLINTPGGTQRILAKNIYISDLFDSLRIPSAFYLQNLRFRLRPKLASDILIKDSGFVAAPNVAGSKFFITGITLYLTMVNLTENQLQQEKDKILTNQSILRESFSAFDSIQKTFTQSASYRDSNVKNLQAAVLMFPSTGAADALGINRYQYCYNATAGTDGATGISSYQMRYDNIYSPSTPLAISPSVPARNTDLFAQYRLLAKKMWERDITPALKFRDSYANPKATTEDSACYVLFCAQFFPLTAYGHKTMAGADHEIITAGGGSGTAIIVRIRLAFLEIRGDTSVYMVN